MSMFERIKFFFKGGPMPRMSMSERAYAMQIAKKECLKHAEALEAEMKATYQDLASAHMRVTAVLTPPVAETTPPGA